MNEAKISIGALPQIEWQLDDLLRIQMTEWRKGSVVTYVWLGESNKAIYAFNAESFAKALDILKTDTLYRLENAIESLRTLELPDMPVEL